MMNNHANPSLMGTQASNLFNSVVRIVPYTKVDPSNKELLNKNSDGRTGWIMLRYDYTYFKYNRPVSESKFARIRNTDIQMLQHFINQQNTFGNLPGKIYTVEYLLTEVPDDLKRLELTPSDYTTGKYKPKTYEELVFNNAKKDELNEAMLTYNGVIIMKFNFWDPEGTQKDCLLDIVPNGTTKSVNGADNSPIRKFAVPSVHKLS